MQRPWGRTVPGVLEEQRGGPFGWSRESKGERERGKGQVVQGLVGLWGGLGVLCKGH